MKKIFTILTILCLTFTLTSCGIKDVNGEFDYSIATITDEQIINGNVNSFFMFENYHIQDNGSLFKGEYSAKKFSGVKELYTFTSSNDIIRYKYFLTCETGNAMIVIVSNDTIIERFEANKKCLYELDNNGSEYRILIVGESADITVEFEVLYGYSF